MKKLLFILFFCLFFIKNYAFALYDIDAAIIGAMDCEIEVFRDSIKNLKVENLNNFKIYKGKIGKNKVIVVKSGVGKVNASMTTQFVIDKYKPLYIINSGIAGALDKNLKTGDLIMAKGALQYDYDISAFGYPKGYVSGEKDSKSVSIYDCDNFLNEKVKNEIIKKYKKINIKEGIIASGDKFLASDREKDSINSYFRAHANDMESAAIVRVANFNKVPCLIIRMISDNSDNNAINDYSNSETKTAQKSAQILKYVLENINLKRIKGDKEN